MEKQSSVFDTNVLIDFLSGRPEAQEMMEKYNVGRSISVVTWMEVLVGVRDSRQEAQTRQFLSHFDVLPVTQSVSERAVELRRQYKMKLPDAIILASTHVAQKTLLTRNTKDFKDIPGVIVPYSLL